MVCTENDQCVGGICRGTPIDTSSVLDNGSVGEKAKLPPDLVDGINKFINKVPGLGGITFNTLDVTGTGKLRACCGESVGYLKTGREEKAVEVSLGFEFKDKPLGALGNKANILIDVGIGIVQLDVVVGVLFSSNVAIKAKGGKIDDKCKPETCEFGSLNAAFTPGLKLELTAEVCFLSSGNSVSCTGFIVQPVSATFPLSLGIDVNGRGCNSGISGVGKAGPLKVTFSYKFLLGSIPLQGSYNYEPPFASGYECRLPGGCG